MPIIPVKTAVTELYMTWGIFGGPSVNAEKNGVRRASLEPFAYV